VAKIKFRNPDCGEWDPMKHNKLTALLGAIVLLISVVQHARAAGTGYTQTDLVSNGAVPAAHVDPNLINPWGISFFPGVSPFWVSDNNAGVSTLYDGTGTPFPSPPATPLIVDIPSPTDPTQGGPTGAPTGQVANLTAFFAAPAFKIPGPNGADFPALFIFATEDGTIEAWNTTVLEPDGTPSPNPGFPDDAVIVVDNSTSGAVYKGLAMGFSKLGKTAGKPFLYATNFRTGNIDVFDGNFQPMALSGSFTDQHVQHGYAPFGIQNIGGKLWVTYAMQDEAKHDPVNKPAHGFVTVFDTDGNLIQHFAQHGHLSSPWGVAMAPASFGQFAADILVGNFGNGQINAYDPATGHWLGMLSDANGIPIINPGLWTVTFSGPAGQTALGADPDTLYITAGLEGPTHELAGLFAKISPNP
jgi:uncharacterized protein (TIGR03118 family)